MKSITALVLLLTLSACSLPVFFRVPVVQGNVVTEENVSQLELGMTKRQVEYVMGTALVDSSFENDRWDYVFYYRDPRADVRKSELNLYFTDGELAEIDGDEAYTRAALKGDTPMPAGTTPGPNGGSDEPYEPDNDDQPAAPSGPIGPPGPNDTPGRGPLSTPLPGA
ncbi:outer membrane protein assembly factor BamE [Salinisphaera orenii]|nr:outer membrane protein assembly factor BamE [Salinisphaera halophila]